MKKLFFLLAISSVGLLSAKNDENQKPKDDVQTSTFFCESTQSVNEADLLNNQLVKLEALKKISFPVTFSCGVTLPYEFPDDTSFATINAIIWYHDTLWCPN